MGHLNKILLESNDSSPYLSENSPPQTQISMIPCSFLILIIIASSSFQLGLTFDERFVNCGNITCGNMTVTYPLRIAGKEDYCGLQEYELECQGDNLTATISSQKYRVLDVVWEKQSLTIVRMDLLENICPQEQGDIVLDYSVFNYTGADSSATLLYNCDSQLSQSNYDYNCSTSSGSQANFWAITSDYSSGYGPSCSSNISVPVLKSSISDLLNNATDAEQALKDGFEVTWNLDMEECKTCVSSGGRCGYNTTTDEFSCFCSSGAYGSACPGPATGDVPASGQALAPEVPSSGNSVPVKIVIGVTIGGMLILLPIILYLGKKLKQVLFNGWRSDGDIENFINHHGSLAPKRFSYAQVKRMTNSLGSKLSQGGFGAVYRGKLPDGTLVAVKLLNASKGNGEEFINEVASISRTSHINIVALLGFCYEGHRRALIYEFMSNGSLDKFIHDENALRDGTGLAWENLYQIAVGIARGLEYLHRGCSTRILHFDIKPQNILLDDELRPKISDFGLSKLCVNRESIVSMLVARGTVGYIAPEVFIRNFGGVSHKSDVYSYGMMLLEMVGGRKNNLNDGADQSSEVYFHDQVYQLIEDGYDRGLYGRLTEEEKESARKMALVGVWCIQTDPKQRPSMGRVIEMLEGSTEALPIPAKPFWFSPPRQLTDSLSISVSM